MIESDLTPNQQGIFVEIWQDVPHFYAQHLFRSKVEIDVYIRRLTLLREVVWPAAAVERRQRLPRRQSGEAI